MATGFNKSMILKQSFVFDYASSAMKKPLYSSKKDLLLKIGFFVLKNGNFLKMGLLIFSEILHVFLIDIYEKVCGNCFILSKM